MNLSDTNALKLITIGAALACALAGCGGGDDESTDAPSPTAATATTTTPTSEPAPAAAADYSVLLIDAADIPAPEPFLAESPMLSPTGVAQLYHTASGAAAIGDTIEVFPDAAQAEAALAKAVETIGTTVTGSPQPSAVAGNATVVAGTSPEGDRAVTVLMFTEQNAFVTLQFDSQPGDLNPVPLDFVDAVGALQQEAIQAELPNVGTASAGGETGPASITVDGQPLNVQGPVECSTNDGKFSIAIGDPLVGVIVGLEPDASVVRGVGLGSVNGVVLSFTEGVPGNEASATKDGNNYVVTGTATGVDDANPAQQISKPFMIDVTCP